MGAFADLLPTFNLPLLGLENDRIFGDCVLFVPASL